MGATSFRKSKLLAGLILGAGFAFSQTAPKEAKETTLVLKGYAGRAPVVLINGKSYVEIESLARLTNGSLTFQPNQITLTLAAPVAGTAPAPADPVAKPALSKGFVVAATDELSLIREWRADLLNAIQNSYPLTEEWATGYRRNVRSKLALAGAAVSRDPDREVFALVTNEFNNMNKLSDQYVAMHKTLAYISPDSLDNDALNQQVLNCAHELDSLAASGQSQDVPVCH
jgi:hypothetical protein